MRIVVHLHVMLMMLMVKQAWINSSRMVMRMVVSTMVVMATMMSSDVNTVTVRGHPTSSTKLISFSHTNDPQRKTLVVEILCAACLLVSNAPKSAAKKIEKLLFTS
jgi:hypothetical protein